MFTCHQESQSKVHNKSVMSDVQQQSSPDQSQNQSPPCEKRLAPEAIPEAIDSQSIVADVSHNNVSLSQSHQDSKSRDSVPSTSKANICTFYQRSGWCKFGNKCRYTHDPEARKQRSKPGVQGQLKGAKICHVYASSGNCRFGANCRFLHITPDAKEQKEPRSDVKDSSAKQDEAVEQPKKVIQRKICKYFKEGGCVKAASCRFYHPKEKLDVADDEEKGGRGAEADEGKNRADEPPTRLPVQLQSAFKISELTDDDVGRLRTTEVDQLLKRFTKENVLVMENEDKPSVYRITINPTDPEWPFDMRDFVVNVSFPDDYPLEPFKTTLPEDQDLPSIVIKHLSSCAQEWVNAKHETNQFMGKVELLFRPFLRWFDRNLEKLFTEGARSYKKEVDAEAAGFEFVPNRPDPKEASKKIFSKSPENTRKIDPPKDAKIITQKVDGVIEKSNRDNDDEEYYSDCESSDEEGYASSEEGDCEKAPLLFDSPSTNPRGTEMVVRGFHLSKTTSSMAITKVSVVLQCSRCKNRCNITTPPRRKNLIPCVKCQSQQFLVYRPCLMHEHSNVMGFLDIEGCLPFDVNLTECHLQVGCLNCSRDCGIKGIQNGQMQSIWCEKCHKKLELKVESTSFQKLQPSEQTGNMPIHVIKVKGMRRQKDPAIVEGKPLPNNGTCKHYKKSFRWLRFPCCGQFYPCDECHDGNEDHEMQFANRMLCGYCAKEQPYSLDKPCVSCNSATTKGRTAHWEGGLGCRNKTKMSRMDKQKYAGTNKTVSKKAQSKEESTTKKKGSK